MGVPCGQYAGDLRALCCCSFSEPVLRYEVELLECERLAYFGSCLMEVRDGCLVLLSAAEREEVVKWRLAHIRSFKAKKNILTITAGRSVFAVLLTTQPAMFTAALSRPPPLCMGAKCDGKVCEPCSMFHVPCSMCHVPFV